MTPRVTAIVLAAGRATRFGSTKVLAPLDGRPVLAHVLERIAEAGIGDLVVVLGDDAAALERAIEWPVAARRVVNPDPSRGLASSLVLGVVAARSGAGPAEPDALLIALGDQPRLSPAVITRLVAALDGPHPFVVPRYDDGANPNPVLVARAGFELVEQTTGDRGLGPLLAARPELVLEVPVPGANPDVDTPDDLRALQRAAAETPDRATRHPVG